MSLHRKLKVSFRRTLSSGKFARRRSNSVGLDRSQAIENRRWLKVEHLEERRLLASDLLAFEQQPHFFGNATLLSAAADPSPGEIAWDPVKNEEHNRAVAERVKDNPNYRVDELGNVLAINPFTIPLPESGDKDESGSGDDNQGPGRLNPFPADQTFLLHSLPGATKTVYLDFNGHTTTQSSWTQYNGGNNIVTTAFNFEGDANSFTNNELFRIQRIWERVAEDFLPFHVNVTTEEPPLHALVRSGGGDTQWGVRVVIGPDNWFGGAGGVAFLNSFNWNSDTPCFVFSNALGNSEKSIAEAISHEVGHTLGLNHDGQGSNAYYTGHGSGATGWAPIMGVGYNRELVQWSRGEYPNPTNTEDDLQLITTLNGFTYRTDDHGNNVATATPLLMDGTSGTAEGIIERNTDIDFFSFTTTGGNVTMNINPFYRSPNLDILAKLYNSSGTEIASSNPVTTLNASFNTSLSAGTYFVSVQGTGKAAAGSDHGYSNYGSLGFYSIVANIPQQPATLTATLAGGNLTISDTAGVVNQMVVTSIAGNLVITDANEKFASAPAGGVLSNGDRTLTIPAASVTGTVTIALGGGNDTLDIGNWGGASASGLTVDGQTGVDTVNFTSDFIPGSNRSLQVTAENINIDAGTQIDVAGTGSITLTTDSLSIGSSAFVSSSGNSVTIAPQTAGREINLGTKLAGQLGMSASELNAISASSLVIGNAASGRLTVSNNISLDAVNVELRSGGDVLLSGGTVSASSASVLMAPGSAPFGVKPKSSGTDVSANSLNFASNLILEINGPTPDSGYDRLNVAGTVNLTGVNLNIAGSFPGITGNEVFTIVSANNIIGTFNGLPSDAPVVVHGQTFYITYSGNSVQLAPAANFSSISQTYVYHAGSSFAVGGITPALDTQKSLAKAGAAPVTLSLNNLLNSSRGINGIVMDFEGLPVASLSASDFQFQVSPTGSFVEADHPPGLWQTAPALPTVSVLPGTLDRVVLEWPNNAIANRWLRITVLANENTGLEGAETYYIGHLLGETTGADAGGLYSVSFADITPIRAEVGQTVGPGSIYDIDKNGGVTFADISAMRGNVGSQLRNITIPPAGSGIPQSAPSSSGSTSFGSSVYSDDESLAAPAIDLGASALKSASPSTFGLMSAETALSSFFAGQASLIDRLPLWTNTSGSLASTIPQELDSNQRGSRFLEGSSSERQSESDSSLEESNLSLSSVDAFFEQLGTE